MSDSDSSKGLRHPDQQRRSPLPRGLQYDTKNPPYGFRRERHEKIFIRQWKDEVDYCRERAQIREAWTSLIRKVHQSYVIDWFATLTFRRWVSPKVAMRRFDIWVHEINREEFGSRYWRKPFSLAGVVALEWQQREVPHLHALLATGGAPRDVWSTRWNIIAGDALIVPYRHGEGADSYLPKSIHLGGEIDVVGRAAWAPKVPNNG